MLNQEAIEQTRTELTLALRQALATHRLQIQALINELGKLEEIVDQEQSAGKIYDFLGEDNLSWDMHARRLADELKEFNYVAAYIAKQLETKGRVRGYAGLITIEIVKGSSSSDEDLLQQNFAYLEGRGLRLYNSFKKAGFNITARRWNAEKVELIIQW